MALISYLEQYYKCGTVRHVFCGDPIFLYNHCCRLMMLQTSRKFNFLAKLLCSVHNCFGPPSLLVEGLLPTGTAQHPVGKTMQGTKYIFAWDNSLHCWAVL